MRLRFDEYVRDSRSTDPIWCREVKYARLTNYAKRRKEKEGTGRNRTGELRTKFRHA